MIAVALAGPCDGVTIHDMTLTNITSDCFTIQAEAGAVTNLRIVWNTVTEWYESFFNHHEGSGSNYVVANNTCTVGPGHPNISVERPSCIFLNIEDPTWPGLVENVLFSNNSFVSHLNNYTGGVPASPGSGTDFVNSIGFSMRQNNDPDYRYHRIYTTGNLFDGFEQGLFHVQTQPDGGSTLFPGTSFVYYLGNTFQNNGSIIASVDNAGMTGDIVVVGDNDFIRYDGGQTGLALPTDGGTPTTITQSPPNRVTGP
jgi:hypothetical protein